MTVGDTVPTVGFTGTSIGMTGPQRLAVSALLDGFEFAARHGDCVGADDQFDLIVRGKPGLRSININPSNVRGKRAWCASRGELSPSMFVRVHREAPPLVRNWDIVGGSTVMIAAPRQPNMIVRSGTWTTVRNARQVGCPVAIALPNGSVMTDAGWLRRLGLEPDATL